MKKARRTSRKIEMRPEYDFRTGIRGKYADRFSDGTNLILLEPDVAREFPDAKSVNEALRALIRIARRKRTSRAG